jgi:hypothetical protein
MSWCGSWHHKPAPPRGTGRVCGDHAAHYTPGQLVLTELGLTAGGKRCAELEQRLLLRAAGLAQWSYA